MEARHGTGAINRAIYHTLIQTVRQRQREGRETGTDHYMKTVGEERDREEAKPRIHSPFEILKGRYIKGCIV